MRINRRKMKFYRRKMNAFMSLTIILMLFTIGYAYLSSGVTINGTGYINKAEWDVHFENIQTKTGSVTPTIAPSISNDTSVSFSVSLDNPGDFYEFNIDVVNGGTIPAMIDSMTLSPTLTTEQANYFEYGVTYSDGVAIAPKHLLDANTTETLRVFFYYKENDDVEMNPLQDQNFQFRLTLNYVQADDTGVEVDYPIPIADSVNLGDYISLTPDKSTYTISSSLTGYTSDQTITPNELTLWRVISKNDDDSVDVVSEYVSSTGVYFRGVQGYANFVGGLQTIAEQYAKEGYTQSTRMMGYDGQTLTISDTSAFDGSTNTAPGTTTTPDPETETGEEYSGGVLGDTLYLKDYQLVSNVYKTDAATYEDTGLKAYKVGTTTATEYWLSSRRFGYDSATLFYFRGRRVNNDGNLSYRNLRNFFNKWGDSSLSSSVRPIITLNSGVSIASGSGTSASPYVLN